jgi:carboxymethylenebutenolidase
MNFSQRYLVDEYVEEYEAQRLGRRELMRRVLLVTGSIPLAASVLFALGCSSGGAKTAATATAPPTQTPVPPTPPPPSGPGVTVPATDPGIQVEEVRFKGPASDVIAYLSRPRGNGPFPTVIVNHENRGLVEHIKDITRRYAKEGFAALAPDLLSRQGGTPADLTQAASLLSRTNPEDLDADLKASVDYLKTLSFVRSGAIGTTGFCMGGNFTWDLALTSLDIRAAIPYYGRVRLLDQIPQTRAAVLAIYGGNDNFVTPQSVQVEEGLKAAAKTYEIKIYPGANHAFFNDTSGSYNADAAKDAWQITLAWFRKYLTL